ncbi:DNA replication and repair protein RecO [Jannaschia faecimaris]|uniref:DNA repair protein RecO n=1 Tax=Jannaschia faecimaris TaxID=1244108 RepID=A0A1H3U0A1_9RHOB|nr:DNA repair protein RecO [Jannaschia faecimaris]SDZ55778.1 DNA replication and repair protein RecO [Jannaschia faecimaris]
MDWRDEGIVLSARPHGETSVILELLTRAHGRHLGVVHGGVSRKKAPMLQPGNQVDAAWRARLESHLGTWTVELKRSRSAGILGDPIRLFALSATCALASFALPEREDMAEFQRQTEALCDAISDGKGWLTDYVHWEMALLEVTGFRLDLSACAVSGGANDLAYVSPRTGRAVSRSGAGEWASKLLKLPDMMIGGMPSIEGVVEALAVTGHFLETKLAPSLGNKSLPSARARLVQALSAEV